MGFNEVEACIKHWLTDLPESPLRLNVRKVGIRQTSDLAIALDRNPEVKGASQRLHGSLPKQRKTVLVTGSTGVLGRRLVAEMTKRQCYEIHCLDRDRNRATVFASADDVTCYDWRQFDLGSLSLGNVDCLVHLASARPHHGEQEIAASLRRTFELFQSAAVNGVQEIVNISSQSVYGHASDPPWREESPIAPSSPYAQAKYASELLLQGLSEQYPSLRGVSLRLDAVTGAEPEILEHEAWAKMVAHCVRSQRIAVVGGEQTISRIDAADAVDGILAVIHSDSSLWRPIYNLGSPRRITLLDLAGIIEEEVRAIFPEFKIQTTVDSEKRMHSFGMDVSRFAEDFSWSAGRGIHDTIRTLVNSHRS
jgi:nucleoside-diphosphate-sugar epimerase